MPGTDDRQPAGLQNRHLATAVENRRRISFRRAFSRAGYSASARLTTQIARVCQRSTA